MLFRSASVENYEAFMQAITSVSPVPIRYDEIEGESHGYYHLVDKEIVIQSGMSESQTMKTAIMRSAMRSSMTGKSWRNWGFRRIS